MYIAFWSGFCAYDLKGRLDHLFTGHIQIARQSLEPIDLGHPLVVIVTGRREAHFEQLVNGIERRLDVVGAINHGFRAEIFYINGD